MPKRKSPVWKFFIHLSKEDLRCRVCNKPQKTPGNLTNMKKHLLRWHKNDGTPIDQIYFTETTEAIDEFFRQYDAVKREEKPSDSTTTSKQNEGEAEKSNLLRSPVWSYFKKFANSNRDMKCRICDAVVRNSGHTNCLKKHLIRRHKFAEKNLKLRSETLIDPIEQVYISENTRTESKNVGEFDEFLGQSDAVDAEEKYPESSTNSIRNDNPRKNRIPIRQSFIKLNDTESKCRFCNLIVKSLGNTTNLKTHLIQRHKFGGIPIEEIHTETTTATSEDGSTSEAPKSTTEDIFAEEFEEFVGEYDDGELGEAPSKRSRTKENNIPKDERHLFSQFVHASLNQLSERNALNAMLDLQGVLTKYRLASMPDDSPNIVNNVLNE